MVERDQPAAQGEREPRRHLRGPRLRAGPRARLPRLLGRAPRRPDRAGDWSRSSRSRGSRSARPGRSPPKRGSEAHDEIFHTPERGFFRETNRAGGVEGGMTNGEPLVVAGRDQADLDPDQAAALGRHPHQGARSRPTRSGPTRPWSRRRPSSARRCSRSSSPAPTARSSAAITSTTSAAAIRRLLRAHRLGAMSADRLRRLHGGRQEPRCAGRRAGARRVDPIDTDELIEAELGEPIAAWFAARGGGRVPRRRGTTSRSRRSSAERSSRSAAARSRPRRSGRRSPATSSSTARSARRSPGSARAGTTAARSPPTATSSAAASSARAPLYEELADAILPRGGDETPLRGRAVARGDALGARAYGWPGHGPATPSTRRWSAAARPRSSAIPLSHSRERDCSRSPTVPRMRLSPGLMPGEPVTVIEVDGGEADEDAGGGRAACSPSWLTAGARRDDALARLRRRRRRRSRRLLRGHLPARHPGRPGADDARGPGRLGLRRQDRGRPARGQELRRRLPPARRRPRRSRGAREPAGRRAGRRLRRGRQDRPDRRRAPLGAGPRGRPARSGRARRGDLPLRSDEARGRRRGRARRRPSRRPQSRPHGRSRDRDGHRLRPLPPRRGDRARPPGGAAALRSRGASGRGRRAARRCRPADDPRRRGRY